MRRFAQSFACLLVLSAFTGCATKPAALPPEVVLIGDSTMSFYGPERYPRMGWGMVLTCGLDPAVRVTNLASSGRSTKSFIAEGKWETALAALDRGDVLIIQFGHNDAKIEDPTRYAPADGLFRQNLEMMIAAARAKGAIPVLVTPVARRRFVRGHASDTHGPWGQAVRSLAAQDRVYLVDLLTDSLAFLDREGEAQSQKLFLHVTPEDRVAAYPQGVSDDTHFSEAGARAMASLVTTRLAEANAPLRHFARPDAQGLRKGFQIGGPGCER